MSTIVATSPEVKEDQVLNEVRVLGTESGIKKYVNTLSNIKEQAQLITETVEAVGPIKDDVSLDEAVKTVKKATKDLKVVTDSRKDLTRLLDELKKNAMEPEKEVNSAIDAVKSRAEEYVNEKVRIEKERIRLQEEERRIQREIVDGLTAIKVALEERFSQIRYNIPTLFRTRMSNWAEGKTAYLYDVNSILGIRASYEGVLSERLKSLKDDKVRKSVEEQLKIETDFSPEVYIKSAGDELDKAILKIFGSMEALEGTVGKLATVNTAARASFLEKVYINLCRIFDPEALEREALARKNELEAKAQQQLLREEMKREAAATVSSNLPGGKSISTKLVAKASNKQGFLNAMLHYLKGCSEEDYEKLLAANKQVFAKIADEKPEISGIYYEEERELSFRKKV